MTTEKPGCLTALLRMVGIGKQGSGITVRDIQPEALPYHLRDDFLSAAETSFFQVLKTMAGEGVVVCPQVALSAIFFVPRGETSQAYQNKIDRKRVDFLLCDAKTLKPLLAIELDDASHERPDRQERDVFVEQAFAAAQLPLVRVPVQQAYNTHELAEQFKAAIQKKPTGVPAGKPVASPQAAAPLCPKCGVPMLLRTAKRGNNPGQQFYGCPNYPRCQAVIPIK